VEAVASLGGSVTHGFSLPVRLACAVLGGRGGKGRETVHRHPRGPQSIPNPFRRCMSTLARGWTAPLRPASGQDEAGRAAGPTPPAFPSLPICWSLSEVVPDGWTVWQLG
jgi:hypothetical protein